MFWGFCAVEPSDLAGLGACCSTEGKTLLAHIQGPLLPAENLITMAKSFHSNFQSQQQFPMPKAHAFI